MDEWDDGLDWRGLVLRSYSSAQPGKDLVERGRYPFGTHLPSFSLQCVSVVESADATSTAERRNGEQQKGEATTDMIPLPPGTRPRAIQPE